MKASGTQKGSVCAVNRRQLEGLYKGKFVGNYWRILTKDAFLRISLMGKQLHFKKGEKKGWSAREGSLK